MPVHVAMNFLNLKGMTAEVALDSSNLASLMWWGASIPEKKLAMKNCRVKSDVHLEMTDITNCILSLQTHTHIHP